MTLRELDQRYVWHPFTPMREWLAEPPLVIDRAEGNELIDVEGNRYLDGVSSLWVNVHGHAHPTINAAISAQLSKVSHSTLLGLASTPSILLAQRLVALSPPGLSRVFFSDSGSTAVEVALKIAFQFQQLRGFPGRTKFLSLRDAYHGDTIGSVSLGGIDTFHKIFHPLLFQTIQVEPSVSAIREAFTAHSRELAAFILEPLVQGAAGILLSPTGLLAEARTLCSRHGVLLIADEVATGFGRTGTMFACEQEEVCPDLLAVAKGLSGGYLPVAATLATDEVFHQFLGASGEQLTFFHGHSFGGNPLGCAAALASLDVFDAEGTLAHLPSKISALRTLLSQKVQPLLHVFEIRQKGLMVGIELRKSSSEPYPPEQGIGARVCLAVRRHGAILRPLGSVVVLMPPLSISSSQLVQLVDATAKAITEVTETSLTSSLRSPAPLPCPPSSPSFSGIFLLGTDTAVGKTTVALAILSLARSRGLSPVPFKPVETGAESIPLDSFALLSATGREDISIGTVCPYTFTPPVAPALAAEQSGVSLNISDILAAASHAANMGDYLLVEAAGGVLTPYSQTFSAADLASHMQMPVLLIARNSLGTINHTLLAISEIRRRRLPFLGVLFVNTTPSETPDRPHNAPLVKSIASVNVLGALPYLTNPTPDSLALALSQTADVDLLFPKVSR